MENKYADMQGRQVIIPNKLDKPAIEKATCLRCYAKIEQWMCGPQGLYCWTCYQMGTIKEKQSLITMPETNNFVVADKILYWNGQLTERQQEIANQLCQEKNENQLVHAVTGAGKTEMLYPVLEQTLSDQKRVAFVAPRVDVIQELAARIKPIFNVTQGKMTGDTKDTKQHEQLVFATIHQLFKFKDAFDLIIVDECDAFPLEGNTWLKGAITKALKKSGRLICLTATLPDGLAKRFEINQKKVLRLYRRFHGYPLPNLEIHYCGNWRKKWSRKLQNVVKETDVPLLIFVPKVADCRLMKEYLQKITDRDVGMAFAGQADRLENIQAFKDGQTNILVATILLERGITFPGIDVIVLGAEEDVFTTASLIQIAGRCGRTIERPTGHVYVYTRWKMRKIQNAYREIARMNQ